MIDVYHKLIEMAQKPDLTPDEQFALGYAAGKIEPAGGWVKTLKANPETGTFEKVYPEPGPRIEMAFRDEKGDWDVFTGCYTGNAFFVKSFFFRFEKEPDYWRYMIYPEAPE